MALAPKMAVAPAGLADSVEMLVSAEMQKLIGRVNTVTGLGALSISSAILNVVAYGLVDLDQKAASEFLHALADGMACNTEEEGKEPLERGRDAFQRIVNAYHAKLDAMTEDKGTIQ